MQDFDIEEGGMYVNERKGFLRVAQKIVDHIVQWRDYGLNDGEPIGHGACQYHTFRDWADRPATVSERARLRQDLALAQDAEMLRGFLDRIPDFVLDDEHVRRGLFDRRLERMLRSDFLASDIIDKISDAVLAAECQKRGMPSASGKPEPRTEGEATEAPVTASPGRRSRKT